MKSKIINMVERLKDKEDLKLEVLFRSEPIADAGFSERVMARIRRQIWVRRLALPVAFVIGASIAARPLVQLVQAVSALLEFIPQTFFSNLDIAQLGNLPAPSTLLLGVALLLAAATLGKMARQ